MNFMQENLTSVKRSEDFKNDAIMSRNQVLGKPIMAPPTNPTSKRSSNPKTPSSSRKKPTLGTAVLKSGSSRMVDNSQVIVAICEGRGQARGIVGIAAIDVNKPVLVLCQISDTQTYTNTLTKINILRPVEVLIPSSFVECTTPSRIITLLKDQFSNLTVSSVSRSAFRSSRGLSYVTNLCAPQFISVNLVIRQKFYALASASALIKYIQKEHHVIYPANSIKVEYQEPENTAVIDIDSADRLELVSCCNQEERAINLLSMLDHCVTGVGRKMLRATILQPPCVDSAIQARLDCVQELHENAEFRIKLKAILTNLHNIECALLFGTMVPQSAAAVSDKQLNYTLQLKTLLTNIEPLRDVLEVAHHPMFRSIHEHLVQAPYSRLLNKLYKVLNEEAHPASGHAGDLQRCFAIRTGLNGFLDIARRTYMEVMDDMRAYVQNLSDKYSLPFRIHHTQKRGFHIVLNLTGSMRSMEKSSLPSVFVKVERNTTHFTMTTSDMTSFGVRLQTNCQEIESISNVIIYQLMANIKQCIGHLYQLCDDVALLDVLQSLATVSTTSGYIRPKFSTEYMEIISARHPLLEHSCTQEPVPNNIVASDLYNLHIVTGPNMSGKSIYVRQMPLLQVLAQIGCYVPARSAVLRSCTHVYARISVEDYLHDNSSTTTSTFVREMTEIQYMLNTVGTGSRSLIILDELCHSTSVDEGVSIAIAICEQLLKTKAYTFVATHYLSMTKLANMYSNVNNSHLEAVETVRNTRKSLKFTHRLIAGVNGVETYGIKLSRICGGSDLVSDRAEQILHDILPTNQIILPSEIPQNTSHLKFRLYADLKMLQLQNKLTVEAEQKLLEKYEQLTGKHYDIGQILTEDKVPSRTSSSRGSRKTKSTPTTSTASSKQSTVQSLKQSSKSSTSVYDVARQKYTSRTSDISTSKSSDYLSKVVDSLIPSEEDFLHCITAEDPEPECGDPLGVSVKQTDAQSDDSSDLEVVKDNQTDNTAVIELDSDSPTYSPNFDMFTDPYSPACVPYTPDSSPADIQLPEDSPPSPSLTSNDPDFERKSLPIQPSDTRFFNSLSYDSQSPSSVYSDPINPVTNHSEANYSITELYEVNQPDSNPIDLKDPASEPFELNYLHSKPLEINSLVEDSLSCDPKTSYYPTYETNSSDTSSSETISFKADISDGGTVKKIENSGNDSNAITFEYNDEMELCLTKVHRKKDVAHNEPKQCESVTISTYCSVSNYYVIENDSLEHTARQETRYTSYQGITPNFFDSRCSTLHHCNKQEQIDIYPSTSGYMSNVRSSQKPSYTTLQNISTNVYPSTSGIQSESRIPHKQDSFGARFQEQNQFTDNKPHTAENSPFIFHPVLPPIKPFTFDFSAIKEPESCTDKSIFGNTVPQQSNFNSVPWYTSTVQPVKSYLPLWSDKEEKPKENSFTFSLKSSASNNKRCTSRIHNTENEMSKENRFKINLKPSTLDRKLEKFRKTTRRTSKIRNTEKGKPKVNTFKFNMKPSTSNNKSEKEKPTENTFKFNLKSASDNKWETFLETAGNTSTNKHTIQTVMTKPYIPYRINRNKNQKQKSADELNTLYDYFMADLEANQKKIKEVLEDDDDDDSCEFDRKIMSNVNYSGKKTQQQNKAEELFEISQENERTIMPNRPVTTWDDLFPEQPVRRYNDSAVTNRAYTKSVSNTVTNDKLTKIHDDSGWNRHLDRTFIGDETIRSSESEGTFINYLSTVKGATSTPIPCDIHTKGKRIVKLAAKHRATLSPVSRVKMPLGSLDNDTSSIDEYMPYYRSDDLDLNMCPRPRNDEDSQFTLKTSEISHKKSNVDLVPKKSSTTLYSDLSADGISDSDKTHQTKIGSSTVRTSGIKADNNTSNKLQQQPLEVSKTNKQIVVDETQLYTGSSQSFNNKNASASDMSNVSKSQKVQSDTTSTQSMYKTPTVRKPRNQNQSTIVVKDNKQETVTKDNNKVSESQPLNQELKPKTNKVEQTSGRKTRSATATSVRSEQQQQPSKKTNKVTRKPRGKPKKAQDDKTSEDSVYKKLETHVMAPIRSKRQREMDKFFDDVKRMRTNLEASTGKPDSEYANIQYYPSKKQMSKLEYVAVGQRKTTGEMTVQINTPKSVLKNSPTIDYLIEKYLGKENLQDNPSK